jgi:hypothetical protein
MKCRSVQPLLDEYAAGTLPVSGQERIEAHLSSCPACSADLRMIRGFASAEKEKEWAPSPVYFSSIVPKVRARIESRQQKSGPAWAVRFVLPAAAVVVLLVAVTWFTPRDIAVTSTSISSFSTEELQDFMELQDVVGLRENAPETTGVSDDISVLKDIVRADHILLYSDLDNDQENESVAGQDADKVLAVLESGSTRTNY